MRYAVGLNRLGVKRGDAVAIVGANRPKLYWSVMAVQMLGAVPVPVYADAVADELVHVLMHAEVRFAAVEDQEQVDKILSVAERLPKLERMVYDEKKGLRDYDHSKLHPIDEVIADGHAALSKDASVGAWLDAEIAAGKGSDTSVILYTSGTTGQSKGVMLSAKGCIDAAADTVAFDHLDAHDEALAYLPLAWVGDHYLNYAQGLVAGFCLACPESAETAMQDLKEIGPTFYFAPPRVFEQMLTRVMIRMEDAEIPQAAAISLFHPCRPALWRGHSQSSTDAALGGGCSMRSAGSSSTSRSRTCSGSRACASPIPPAKRSAPICLRSTVRSG